MEVKKQTDMENTTDFMLLNSTLQLLSQQFLLLDLDKYIYPADGAASVVLVCFYIVIFVVALVGNILAMVVLTSITKSGDRFAKNIYLVNLVAADLSGEY